MPPVLIADPATIDWTRVIADRKAIHEFNPQRFEMEMLTAIVFVDPERHVVAGYKQIEAGEFWSRGHLPEHPIFPGVLMCEAAAQLCSYYSQSQKCFASGDMLGFGGMENVRFRAPVRPGDRFDLVSQATKLNRRQCHFAVQGFVGATMAFHADIIGVPLTLSTI